MTADLSALIAKLEAGPVYLTHKEAYDLAIFFGSDTALGMSSMIRKAFVGGSLDAAIALAERVCPDHHSSVGNLPVSDDADYEKHHHFGALLYSRYTKPYDALGHGATPALAFCIAILRAKQGEG